MDMKPVHRNAAVDAARGISIFLVVLSHVIRKGIITDYCAAAGVAAFFYLSGCVYKRPETEGMRYWTARVRRLLIPYAAVSLISIFLYAVLGGIAGESLGVKTGDRRISLQLLNMLYGSSKNGAMKWNETLWFIPCYFVVLILVFLFSYFQSPVLRMVISVIVFAGAEVYIRTIGTPLPWQIETACHMQLFMTAGNTVGKYCLNQNRQGKLLNDQRIRLLKTVLSAAVMFILSAVLMIKLRDISVRIDDYPKLLLSLFMLFSAIGWIILSGRAVSENGTVVKELLTKAGGNSFEIMLWNKFPVLAFQVLLPMVIPLVRNYYPERNDLTGLVASSAVTALCCTACYFWQKTYRKFIKY